MSKLLPEILEKLNGFIKKYYVNELIKGALLFIAIGLLYFILVLVLENSLWFSTTNRKILFWSFIAVESLLFLKFIGTPLAKLFRVTKGISEVEASKIIGSHFPEVNDQLLNLLQLSKDSHSSDLLKASIDQKSKQLSPIQFNLAINFKKSLSYAKYAIIPILFFLIITFFKGNNWFGESLDRVVNYNTAYNPPAPFYFKVLNNNLSVIQDEDFNLKVTTYGNVVPNEIALEYNNETYFLKQESLNKFSYQFKNLKNDVEFKLVSGKQASQNFRLTTNPAPGITDFKMQVIPPFHTGLKSKVYDNTGNALIPEGSKVRWNVASKNASKVTFISESVSLLFQKGKEDFQHSKQIKKAMEYSISSSNQHIENYENLSFALDVVIDKNPSINVSKAKDSITQNDQLFYGQLSDDYGIKKLDLVYFNDESSVNKNRFSIEVDRGTFSEFVYKFPDGLDLLEANTYSFYFEVFDNDSFNGSKSSKSQTYSFRKLSEIEERNSQSKKEQKTLDDFSKTIDEFQKSELDLESFSKFQKQNTNVTFKEKQKLESILEKQNAQQKDLKKLSENLEKTLDKLNEDENSEAIKEQLERTKRELEKNKKLIDEIKKALEKISPQSLQKKVDELQKDSKKLSKNLNQVLELTKRYYVIDKHQRVSQMLELLSEKQNKLAEAENNSENDQQQINKEWKLIQDELNDLRRHNSKLKKPMQLDDDPAYEEKIKKELDKALKSLKQSKMEDAKKKQKTAGTMLKNLADKMQMQLGSGGSGMEELEEDSEMLRQILDNLVLYSLNQESNMKSFQSSNSNDPNYSGYMRKQNVLREHFNHIDDSLYALSSRNPKIGTVVNDLISDIDYELSSSLNKLADNNVRTGVTSLQYAVTHSNDLAVFLSKALGQINEQLKPSSKGDKGSKSKGFQLPDIIKKQESLNKAMQQMMQMGEKKPGDSGQEQSGGEEKGGDKGKKGESGKESTPGENGESGEQGESGNHGQNGERGKNGSDGQNGESGQSGKSGEGGQSGEGGNSGQQGENGQPGKGDKGKADGSKRENGKSEGEGRGSNGEESQKSNSDGDGVKGKNGKKKGDGSGNGEDGEPSEDESDYGELFEIYKQQQMLRNQLEDRIKEEGIQPEEKRILQQMEQVENELLEKGFNDETLKKMLDLKHQLFKLDKAQFQQGKDSKRKSETNKEEFISDQISTPEQIKQYFNTTEILNRHTLPLQPQFKQKVQEYFITND